MLTLRPAEDDMPAEVGELTAHPLADLFPMMSTEEHAALAADMEEHGFREGCEIMLFEGRILDGRNRYRAAREAGVTPRLTNFHPSRDGDPLRYVIARNLNRRHLNETQRAYVASQVANLEQGRPAKEPEGKAANLPVLSEGPDQDANLHLETGGDAGPREEAAALPKVSQADAAKLFNVSERSVRDAVKVGKSGIEELNAAVRAGHLSISAAAKAAMLPREMQLRIAEEATAGKANVVRKVIKQEGRAARERKLGGRQCALPDKRYGVILADPEWRFKTWSEAGMDRSADNHYPTSELTDIADRDVAAIAADDCVLFLWSTAPMQREALAVMEAWGFDYAAQCIWRKAEFTGPADCNPEKRDRGGYSGALVLGTGYWFRSAHEVLLVGTKGNVPCPAQGTQFPSVIDRPPLRHSEKPERFAEMIEAMFPNLPKIELNRRGPARPGWDAWGNEAETDSDEPADAGEVAA